MPFLVQTAIQSYAEVASMLMQVQVVQILVQQLGPRLAKEGSWSGEAPQMNCLPYHRLYEWTLEFGGIWSTLSTRSLVYPKVRFPPRFGINGGMHLPNCCFRVQVTNSSNCS